MASWVIALLSKCLVPVPRRLVGPMPRHSTRLAVHVSPQVEGSEASLVDLKRDLAAAKQQVRCAADASLGHQGA